MYSRETERGGERLVRGIEIYTKVYLYGLILFGSGYSGCRIHYTRILSGLLRSPERISGYLPLVSVAKAAKGSIS